MQQRSAMVVRGGWEGHQPVAASDLFIPFLRDAGFDVTIEDALEVYADEAVMASTDLIVQCWTMGEILPDEAAGLVTAVENGTGLAGWHGGLLDSFRQATEIHQVIGGQFVAHPGDLIDYELEVVPERADHPILAGMPARVSVHTEQYWVHTDPLNDVLMRTTHRARPGFPWHEDVTVPAVWTRRWGQGKVFACAPGHTARELQESWLREMIQRGMLWAARER
ncbi:ThuA domain-containing protein [Serinibacter salmoneus]|uniref:ThuA-like domain-containing protein n=1 Tax=Serinibacter salmoneus TaxID=556530 RepID=A0A2A9CVQ4_9MICO|nr:ThuA domain-containing protein [Serinibacter salmoneus]PFG18497.1 hypothetical protein ATL40_0033 [Serinibacter salmoneus]